MLLNQNESIKILLFINSFFNQAKHFFSVSVMKGRRRDKCNVIDKFTQWYLIGYANVNRTIASPKYISAKRSSWVTPYEDLNSEFAERLSDYYYGQEISAKPVAWDSGTPIFADNYGKRGKLKTFIYMSDCKFSLKYYCYLQILYYQKQYALHTSTDKLA